MIKHLLQGLYPTELLEVELILHANMQDAPILHVDVERSFNQ